jgi:Ni,Fe-hydrogenase maturation factor
LDVYQQWLVGLDEQMAAQDRKVLLLVDNASSHDETGLTLTHVRVDKLPPNTTAKIKQIDQGIIYCIKRKVLNQKMQHAFYCIGEVEPDSNPYHVKLLTAMQWCESAWAQVAEKTIRN